VLKSEGRPSDDLRESLADMVVSHLGKSLRPARILFVRELPKTRNAKIMRRVIRAKYLNADPGDLSSLENPQAVDEIGRAQ
jgi:acetyl-CoA synthetase